LEEMYILKNWSLGFFRLFSAYEAPETCRLIASGTVYDNPKFPDGSEITTSAIQTIFLFDEDNLMIRTHNSLYRLNRDDVNPDYNEFCNGEAFDKVAAKDLTN
jgi:hypothetical protein